MYMCKLVQSVINFILKKQVLYSLCLLNLFYNSFFLFVFVFDFWFCCCCFFMFCFFVLGGVVDLSLLLDFFFFGYQFFFFKIIFNYADYLSFSRTLSPCFTLTPGIDVEVHPSRQLLGEERTLIRIFFLFNTSGNMIMCQWLLNPNRNFRKAEVHLRTSNLTCLF